jgi:hypothetical protein
MKCWIVRCTKMAFIVLALSVCGCNVDWGGGRYNDVKQLALAYNNYLSAHGGTGPQTAEDLGPYLDNTKQLLEALKAGTFVINYGIGAPDFARDGAGNIILTYEKDVPTKGGFVAYGDGTVKNLTADEYQKSITARNK